MTQYLYRNQNPEFSQAEFCRVGFYVTQDYGLQTYCDQDRLGRIITEPAHSRVNTLGYCRTAAWKLK